MRRAVRCAIVALTVAFVALQMPQPNAVAAQGGVLRFADSLDVTTLNPLLATSANVTSLAQLTMAHLVGYDAQSRVVPLLAETVPTKQNGGISADGRTLTYHLRHGVRWSDGVPFTADDVTFTADVVHDPSNNSTTAGSSTWQDIISVTKRDPWTFVVRLRRPDIEVPGDLLSAGALSCILPRHLFTGTSINKSPYNSLPVGIGPFRYTAFHRADAVEMEANPFWYGAPPKLRKVIYKIIPDYTTALNELQTGELDLLSGINGPDIDRVRTIPGKRLARYLDFYISGLFMNVTAPPTNDPAVRRALRLATDRRGIFERITRANGALTESVVPKILPGYADLPAVPFDPQAAGAVLEAAGWKLGGDGIRQKNGVQLAIDVALPGGYQPSSLTVEELRASWKQAGILMQSHVYGVGLFFAKATEGGIVEGGRFNGALFSTDIPGYSSLYNAFGCAAISPHGLNASRYCNPENDADLARLLETDDAAARTRLARTIQQRIYDDGPMVVFYERAGLAAFDERLRGFHPTAHEDFDRGEDLAL